MVDQDAPAGKAGIKEHDVILTMNGNSIESEAQLRRMIHEMPPGRIVTFGVSRDGQAMTVKVQLADKKKEFSMNDHDMKDFHVHIPDIHIPDIDIPSINMVMVTSSARSGVKNGNGVLVRSVEKGSRAEKSGFRAGDVVVKVNDQPVHDTSDFMHAVRSRNGTAVNVGVIRDKKELNLNLTLPSRKESGEVLQEEESLEGPLIDAESAVELSELQPEVARLQPQIEVATEKAGSSVGEPRQDLCREQKKMRQRAEKLKNQSRLQQEQFKKGQERLKMRLEQLRQERRGHGFDI
jgi:C-terminal processing protease CtpA/Prc